MCTNKFKVGDKAVVIDKICGHKFEIGTIVEIHSIDEGIYYECHDELDCWLLVDDELDFVESHGPMSAASWKRHQAKTNSLRWSKRSERLPNA